MKQQKSTAKTKEDSVIGFAGKINLHNKKVGQLGEDLACEFLENRGLKIYERNFAMKFGEIDIVALSYQNNTKELGIKAIEDSDIKKVHIIEVKTAVSRENNKVNAVENAHIYKMRKVAKVGEFYVKQKFGPGMPFSVELIAVTLNLDLSLNKIEYLENLEIY